MLKEYKKHEKERRSLGIPALALNVEQVVDLVELIKEPPSGEEAFILDLLTNRIPAGVDKAAYVKAAFLADVAKGNITTSLISNTLATKLLGTMLGGYNIEPLISLLENEEVGEMAVESLSKTLLIFDAFHDVFELSKTNDKAKKVISSWAEAEWFLKRPKVAECITAKVLKIKGEINTDDISPGPEAWSRPDIPLHALSFLKNTDFKNPIDTIEELEESGHQVAFVGDVVGTGSSRKSATNSLLWHIGNDIPNIPNKRDGGICLGGKIAPIFFNTLEDSGTLAIECDVTKMALGDTIDIYPHEGRIVSNISNEELCSFDHKTPTLLDEVRAGGRIPLIIGRSLTDRTREALSQKSTTVFVRPKSQVKIDKGYTLAQKMVGRACGVDGIRPGTYCEPRLSTVGSQDTTGPMTR